MHRLESEKFPVEHISVVFPNQGALNLPGIGAHHRRRSPASFPPRRDPRQLRGALGDGLVGLGVSEPQARRCQRALEDGNFLLSLHAVTDEEIARAEKIFTELDTRDVCHADERAPAEVRSGGQDALFGWSLRVAG